MGRDLSEFAKIQEKEGISIHAPLWDATRWLDLRVPEQKFQSTRPCGTRRKENDKICTLQKNFNPRAPVGRDSDSPNLAHASSYFNPRAPVGRDRNILYLLLQLYIFNNNFDSINSEKKLFFYYFLLESYIKKCVTQVL